MSDLERLLAARRPFLADGGFETWMFFHEGFAAPEFAAIVLMDDLDARVAMRRYFERFLAMAEAAGTGFVLDTNTWRGSTRWAPRLGCSEADMLRLSRNAVRFARGIRDNWRHRVPSIVLNGVVGPMGDGYVAEWREGAAAAAEAHRPQIAVLAAERVDMVSAITMTNVPEAVGIVRAAGGQGLPAVVSYTVETDGRLPTGQTLGDAIAETDAATGGAPLYYMVNCAHPEHFRDALAAGAGWLERIGGVRANASRLSHAELDAATTLDEGDPKEFGRLHRELARRLPALRVVGGCCGTDHRHVGCVSRHLHAAEPA